LKPKMLYSEKNERSYDAVSWSIAPADVSIHYSN